MPRSPRQPTERDAPSSVQHLDAIVQSFEQTDHVELGRSHVLLHPQRG